VPADYFEKLIPLDNALERFTVLEAGVPFESIYINQQLPAGVDVKLHAGARAGVRVRDFGSWEIDPTGCRGPEREGLFITTTGTAPGQTLSLIIGAGRME
jgi:hypothetical protein